MFKCKGLKDCLQEDSGRAREWQQRVDHNYYRLGGSVFFQWERHPYRLLQTFVHCNSRILRHSPPSQLLLTTHEGQALKSGGQHSSFWMNGWGANQQLMPPKPCYQDVEIPCIQQLKLTCVLQNFLGIYVLELKLVRCRNRSLAYAFQNLDGKFKRENPKKTIFANGRLGPPDVVPARTLVPNGGWIVRFHLD